MSASVEGIKPFLGGSTLRNFDVSPVMQRSVGVAASLDGLIFQNMAMLEKGIPLTTRGLLLLGTFAAYEMAAKLFQNANTVATIKKRQK